jgi:hypothetical protein
LGRGAEEELLGQTEITMRLVMTKFADPAVEIAWELWVE